MKECIIDKEKIEPLDDAHVIIQREDGYRFGSDAVALAKFASGFIGATDTVFDLCSGCGVVGLLVEIYCGARVIGAEIDGAMCDMARRSAALNGFDNVEFFNADIRDTDAACIKRYANGIDAVVCNPPYFKAGSVPRTVAAPASCELTVTLGDVVACAKRLLRANGSFMMVYTCSRLDEALALCRENGLTPKQLTVNTSGKTFLLRCVKCGKPGMTVSVDTF